MVKLLTIDDVASILKLAPRTVRKLPIPSCKVGYRRLYHELDVYRWLHIRARGSDSGFEKEVMGASTARATRQDLAAYSTARGYKIRRRPNATRAA